MNRRSKETPNTVCNEIRSIFAAHDSLAQSAFGEPGHEIEQLRIGARPGNHFDQVQVAGRIEEMRAKEMRDSLGREVARDLGQPDTAGIGAKYGIRRRQPGNSAPK